MLKDGAEFEDGKKYIAKVRDKVTFHYDADVIKKALNNIADVPSNPFSEIITSRQLGYSRLALADDVMRRGLCEVIWGVSAGTDDEITNTLNEALDWTAKRVKAFRDVGEYLCTFYFRDFAVPNQNESDDILDIR